MVGPASSEHKDGFIAALGAMLRWLPALALAMLCLHVAELAMGRPSTAILLQALRNDLVGFARNAWLPVVLALPWMLLGSGRGRLIGVAVTWSVLLLLNTLLIEYHATTGVPLGADLFGYSGSEVVTTAGGASVRTSGLVALAVALGMLWGAMLWLSQQRLTTGATIFVALLLALGCWLSPGQQQASGAQSTLPFNKAAFFVDQSLGYLIGQEQERSASAPALAGTLIDPAHPFLREEQTPDTLGPLLTLQAKTPPNFVFIIVEGLGRTYSGPGARLGSFTPFLDELAKRSLYFENFLAPQGRTFAVLPSIVASLPFGANGYAAMGQAMPPHQSLTGILKQHAYQLRFYTGSNPEFDNQGMFLKRAGVDEQVSERDFAPGLRRSSEWGYADRELIDVVLARDAERQQPFATIVQTTTMHDPFEFPGRPRYEALVGKHLETLGIPAGKRREYTEQSRIYASVLYTDDALRHYFDTVSKLPWYANTIFLITGDHRMPEIIADTRLERYHVPLIIYSPLLKAPLSIKAVSSHFDIAPTIVAYLANNHGISTPGKVAWMGTGLDLEPSFRNLHVLPIKQTKTELSDFISGTTYLGLDTLYTISDNMVTEPLASAGAREQVRVQFAQFTAANNAMIRSGSLMPASAKDADRPYDARQRTLERMQTVSQASTLAVSNTRVLGASGAEKRVLARFANQAASATPAFVPLLIVTDDKGREFKEVYGKGTTLAAGATQEIELLLPALTLEPGNYFISIVPSHPDTGKPVGAGQYHFPFKP